MFDSGATRAGRKNAMLDDVHTRPKSQALFDKIRADILEGQFAPGHWLKLLDLERRYGARRSEVRSALSSLSERGIVEYSKNRGFSVFQRSPEEVRELTEIIVSLEATAAPSIVERATPQDIEALEVLAHQFDALTEHVNHAQLRLKNYQFHGQLNSLASNTLLSKTVRTLRECSVLGPFNRYASYQGLKESSREHFALLDALRRKDVPTFSRILHDHASHID